MNQPILDHASTLIGPEPSDYPTFTYVKRAEEKHEKRLRDAIETPKTIVSVSGPSKTGKTVLVQRVLGEDNILPIYGAQIRHPDDVWRAILQWIEAPSSRVTGTNASDSITPETGVSGNVKIPGIAELGGKVGVSSTNLSGSSTSATFENAGMAAVAREIANSDFTVFFDDFHYIPRELQEAVGRQVKAGSEVGIRFCIASVPHRSDDVVRSNHELRGRTVNIDTEFWNTDDLAKISFQGFEELNVIIDPTIAARLTGEACTSPQIMQALCLQLSFALGVRSKLDRKTDFDVPVKVIQEVLEETSSRADFTSLVKQMHAGPRVRGTERKTFKFKDGSTGDAYRAALLALVADPPSMELNYQEITKRIEAICEDEKPVGSSVTEAYKQIEKFARDMHPDQRIIEWDADAAQGTLSIIDPYFLFFLRASDKLRQLGKSKIAPTMPLFD